MEVLVVMNTFVMNALDVMKISVIMAEAVIETPTMMTSCDQEHCYDGPS